MKRAWVPILAVTILLAAPGAAAEEHVTVTIHFTNQGQPLEDPLQGRFYIYDSEQGENYVSWGHGDRSVMVPQGIYRVVIKYVNGEIEHEEVYEEVDLTEDLEHEIDFNIPFARLTMWVTSGGFPIPRHTGGFKIYRAGERGKPIVSRRPGDTVTVHPGPYDIELSYRGPDGMQTKWLEHHVLDGLQQQTVDVGAATALMRLTMLDGEIPLAADSAVWRVFRRGMREQPLAEVRSGNAVVLDAGIYDIGLFYRVGGRRGERWLVDVEVTANLERRIDVAGGSDRVTVTIRQGGRALRDAWFEIYPAGNRQTELYAAGSGEAVEIRPGDYDIGCFVRRGGIRAETWLENQDLAGPVELEVDLDYREASLRVRPTKRKARGVPGESSNLLVIVDSSAEMLTQFGDGTRLEHVQDTLPDAVAALSGTATNVGLRVFGIAPRSQRDCTDSTLLVPVAEVDRQGISRALRLLRPAGYSPTAYSLEQAVLDLPDTGANSILMITGGTDTCEGSPCAVAARLVREGRVSRIYIVALGADRDAQRRMDCIGDFHAVRSELELQAALREILREVRRHENGTVALFRPGWGELVASGSLLERLRVTAGPYDVFIRAGDKTFTWQGVQIDGDMEATAGNRPPR